MPATLNPDDRPYLIIFDCDGVLIDSEIVVCRLVSEEFTERGYAITPDEVAGHYAGRPEGDMIADIERDWGRSVPADYYERIRQRVAHAYGSELQPTPGVAAMLDELQVSFCVASSASIEKLILGLRSTGLYDRFASQLVSASFVAKGKPAPDVFLYAAGWMRTPVRQCVVVEDSVAGVHAARSAGIRAIGFTGGAHCAPGHADALRQAGADNVIADWRELEACIPSAFSARAPDRFGARHRQD